MVHPGRLIWFAFFRASKGGVGVEGGILGLAISSHMGRTALTMLRVHKGPMGPRYMSKADKTSREIKGSFKGGAFKWVKGFLMLEGEGRAFQAGVIAQVNTGRCGNQDWLRGW